MRSRPGRLHRRPAVSVNTEPSVSTVEKLLRQRGMRALETVTKRRDTMRSLFEIAFLRRTLDPHADIGQLARSEIQGGSLQCMRGTLEVVDAPFLMRLDDGIDKHGRLIAENFQQLGKNAVVAYTLEFEQSVDGFRIEKFDDRFR